MFNIISHYRNAISELSLQTTTEGHDNIQMTVEMQKKLDHSHIVSRNVK